MSVTPIHLREFGKTPKPSQEDCLPLHFSSLFAKCPDWLSASGLVCLSSNLFRTSNMEEFKKSLASSHKDPKVFPRRVGVVAKEHERSTKMMCSMLLFLFLFQPSTSKTPLSSNHQPKDQCAQAKNLQPTLHSLGQFFGKSLNFREFKTISNGKNPAISPFVNPPIA
jgi:hypothetical protein